MNLDDQGKKVRSVKHHVGPDRAVEPGSWFPWEPRKPLSPFEYPEVLNAASAVERAQAVRNSVRRKLLGGSDAVNADDLQRLENVLSTARVALALLAPEHPLIVASQLLAD